MEQNLDKKLELKDKIVNFYNSNKVKIYILIFLILMSIFSLIFVNYKSQKNNYLIAEKFIQAGLYLSSNQIDKATLIYEEIVKSKNKFYSILALNTIIEKDLILDKKKISNYFTDLEKNINSKDQKDLLIFKKALYLIKESDFQKGTNLLKKISETDSSLKKIAEEILQN